MVTFTVLLLFIFIPELTSFCALHHCLVKGSTAFLFFSFLNYDLMSRNKQWLSYFFPKQTVETWTFIQFASEEFF